MDLGVYNYMGFYKSNIKPIVSTPLKLIEILQ